MPKRFVASIPQSQFLLSLARFVALLGGVGSGKTAAGAVKAVKKISEGEDGIIVAPDFPQLYKSTFPEFLKWAPMSLCTNAHLDHPHTQKKIMTFNIRGKEVLVYYGGIEKEKGWAGPNVNWAWFDEGGRKRTRLAFNILAARIRVGLNPQLWVTTTPAGIAHWLYDVFVKGIFDEDVLKILYELGYKGKVVDYFHVTTEDNKQHVDPFYYATLMGLYTGKMREQELLGGFVSLDGAIWDDFEPSGRNVTEKADYFSGVPVEWWVDDGFTVGHPRVILMAQIIPPFINVFDEYVATYELPEISIDNALDRPWPLPGLAYVDSSAAELRSRLWNKNIDTIKATHSVEEGIKRTASWIRNAAGVAHVRWHPRCEFSLKEIPGYVRDSATKKPIKASDNAADALRYGLWFKDREDIWGEEADPDAVLAQRAHDKRMMDEAAERAAHPASLQQYYASIWTGM